MIQGEGDTHCLHLRCTEDVFIASGLPSGWRVTTSYISCIIHYHEDVYIR